MTHKPNPWKLVNIPDVSRNKYVHPELEVQPNPKPDPEQIQRSYILLPGTSTYGLGVQELQDKGQGSNVHPLYKFSDGRQVLRPLTFKENIIARLEDYNTLQDTDHNPRDLTTRLQFWNIWLDSCTGIAYPSEFPTNNTKFKIIIHCPELISIAPNFKESFLTCPYSSLPGVELDITKGKYNQLLTQPEIKEHKGWLTALEDDSKLLEDYVNTLFSIMQERSRDKNMPSKLMGFFLRANPTEDELRALFVYNLNNGSYADGYIYLYDNGSFLLVAPSQKISTS